jgi:hypothetical protein
LTDGDKVESLGLEVSDARLHSFAPAEMITCDECLRANPPTRSKCLYCGANLPLTGNGHEVQSSREAIGQIDQIDQPGNPSDACYVVLAPNQTNIMAELSLAEIASLLHLPTTEVEIAVGSGCGVPLARAASSEQATMLADKLRALGIGVDTIREDTLSLDLPGRKIRALEISDDGLAATPMNGGEISVPWADLILMVNGRLLVKRVEVEERQRRGRPKPLDTRELFSDEPVVDLYMRSDELGWRISSSSFDFSCLGPEKAMTAFENFTTLINLLRLRAPKVEVDDSYRSLRALLANVWPLEPQTRKGEWRRSGAGKVDVSTVTTIDNEIQFNSYSRLRQRLKLRELEGGQ